MVHIVSDLANKAYDDRINAVSNIVGNINGLKGGYQSASGAGGNFGSYQITAIIPAKSFEEADRFGEKLSDLCVPTTARLMGRGWNVSVDNSDGNCEPGQFQVKLEMFAPSGKCNLDSLDMVFLRNRGDAIMKNRADIEALLNKHHAVRTRNTDVVDEVALER